MFISTFTFFFFFFNDTATTEIYTLSLHDALPISHTSGTARPVAPPGRRSRDTRDSRPGARPVRRGRCAANRALPRRSRDRKSTRLNSSHLVISYAVFCLKKKKKKKKYTKVSTKAS